MAKKSNAAKIREFMARNPEMKTAAVAEKFGVSAQYIYVIRSQVKKKLKSKLTFEGVNIDLVHAGTQPTPTEPIKTTTVKSDMVNHPPHYKTGGVETINFIEAKGLDYHLGNVVKYITRAGNKDDEVQDLKKARWYLDRAITARENLSVSV